MDCSFRLATIDDLEEIEKIENECFHNPYKKSDLEYEIKTNPVNKFILCIVDGKIVGFNDFMITFNSATISQIAITEKYRRMGLAQKLLNEMESYFIKEGDDKVETVTLEVRESNTKALALYEKNGYVFITKKQHYYPDGENAIYMIKGL